MANGAVPAENVRLDGRRALVVEDEMLVFMLIESLLEEQGCVVLPAANNLADAERAAREAAFDVAVLDVNLAGKPVFPVARILDERGIPFVFLTGYGPGALESSFRDRVVIQKPFRDRRLIDALLTCLEPSAAAP